MTRTAVVYCRISQDRAGAGLGVERQQQDCRKLASTLGWAIREVYTDNDLSAYSGKARPGYRAMLQSLEAGAASAVITWHTDRLHRSPRELEEYVDLCERHKVVTQTVQAGELDLSTPSGRAVARTLGAWARFESEHKSERIKRAHQQAAEQGRWAGGTRPFGWQLLPDGRPVLNVGEARVVRDTSRRLLAGESLGSLVRELNDTGVLSTRGKRWNYTTLRQVLRRPRNAGLSELHGEILGPSTFPAIVAEDTWRAVCALLEAPERRRSQSNRVRHLLAGIVLCGTCGEPLRSATSARSRTAGTTRTVYRCSTGGTGHAARDAGYLDELVAQVVIERLRRPDAAGITDPVGDAGGDDAQDRRTEVLGLRARLGEAAESYADGVITAAQLAKITKRVHERLSALEGAMVVTARGRALSHFGTGRDPGVVWDALTIEKRRAVVRELMTVTALAGASRGGRFDPESVRISWRTAG